MSLFRVRSTEADGGQTGLERVNGDRILISGTDLHVEVFSRKGKKPFPYSKSRQNFLLF